MALVLSKVNRTGLFLGSVVIEGSRNVEDSVGVSQSSSCNMPAMFLETVSRSFQKQESRNFNHIPFLPVGSYLHSSIKVGRASKTDSYTVLICIQQQKKKYFFKLN